MDGGAWRGYSPWDYKRVRHDFATKQQQQQILTNFYFLVGFLPFKTKIDLDLYLLPVLSEINPVLLVLSGVMLTPWRCCICSRLTDSFRSTWDFSDFINESLTLLKSANSQVHQDD